jgi:predicted HTH transcriptional regulator
MVDTEVHVEVSGKSVGRYRVQGIQGTGLQRTCIIVKRHELRELIAKGESSTLEFKRKFTTSEKIAREIIAFANTTGGILLLGVDDNGVVKGVDSEKEQVGLLEIALHTIEPPLAVHIEVVEYEFLDVVVVHVPKSPLCPHRYNSTAPEDVESHRKVFIRQGDKSITASKEMTRVLRGHHPDAPPLTLSIGDREQRLFTYLERHGRATVHDFARLVNISRRRASQILVRLVRAGVVHIVSDNGSDYYTLV